MYDASGNRAYLDIEITNVGDDVITQLISAHRIWETKRFSPNGNRRDSILSETLAALATTITIPTKGNKRFAEQSTRSLTLQSRSKCVHRL